jgi:antitoxin component YwqK of YwqJK toxin-antitoxin module
MSEHLSDGQIINGKKEGDWVAYYANGNKKSEGAFKNGQKEGKWTIS